MGFLLGFLYGLVVGVAIYGPFKSSLFVFGAALVVSLALAALYAVRPKYSGPGAWFRR